MGDFLGWVTRGIFLLVTLLTVADWLRYRDRTRLDILLMFVALTGIIAIQFVTSMTHVSVRWLGTAGALLLLAQPYLLLRLAQHFRRIPVSIGRLAMFGLLVSWVVLLAVATPWPLPLTLVVVTCFVLIEGYAALTFIHGAWTTRGVNHWRLALVAAGSGLIAAVILAAGVRAALPAAASTIATFSPLLAALAALSYYLGFAPPRGLRRIWQQSELYRFLQETAGDPTAEQTTTVLGHLCVAATQTTGGLASGVVRWAGAEVQERLARWVASDDPALSGDFAVGDGALAHAWRERRPMLIRTPADLDAQGVHRAAILGAGALLAVPIIVKERAWGLLLVFLRHGSLFAEDDLALLALLTQQSAMLLGYVALINEQQTLIGRLHRWAHLFEHAEWGVAVDSADGETLAMMNPAFAKMHGYTVEELVGQPMGKVYAPDTRVGLPEHLRLAHEKGHHTFESIHARKDGTVFPVLVNVTAVKDAEGTVLYRIVNVQDITGRKQAAEAIEKLHADLERRAILLEAANKELEAFAYSVSHDLRTPLRSIDGFSQALLEDYADHLDAVGKDYLQRVRGASQHMAQLIDDLLQLSRVTRSEMHHERVDLSALAQTTATALQKTQPERQVEFVIADGVVAEGDARLLRLVLENLLDNAWKFTGKQPQARIEFGALPQDGGQTACFVRDDGVGFDMAYVAKLFGAFQRLHAMTEFPGTGIGLATVQRIVHRHGGRVWAEGAVGQGATFYFTLSRQEENR